jgi:hypothetical protein
MDAARESSVLNVSLGRLQKAIGAPNNRRKSVNLMEGKEEPHRAQAEPIRWSNSSKTFSGVKFNLSVIRAKLGREAAFTFRITWL